MAELMEHEALTDEDTQKGKYLIFPLGKEEYAIGIRCITEIIGMQPITAVPELPAYVKGKIGRAHV